LLQLELLDPSQVFGAANAWREDKEPTTAAARTDARARAVARRGAACQREFRRVA